jgi:hypothetical protein
MTQRIIMPVHGDVVAVDNIIAARIRSKSGKTYVNFGPEQQGFRSKIAALDFINQTMHEGAIVKGLSSFDRANRRVPA